MLSMKGNTQHQVDRREASKPEQKTAKPSVNRNSEALRDLLFDEIESLRNGEGDPQRANAIAKLAAHIVAVAKLDLEYAAMQEGRDKPLIPMQLGHSND